MSDEHCDKGIKGCAELDQIDDRLKQCKSECNTERANCQASHDKKAKARRGLVYALLGSIVLFLGAAIVTWSRANEIPEIKTNIKILSDYQVQFTKEFHSNQLQTALERAANLKDISNNTIKFDNIMTSLTKIEKALENEKKERERSDRRNARNNGDS